MHARLFSLAEQPEAIYLIRDLGTVIPATGGNDGLKAGGTEE